jgi:hypothetical protein
MHFLSYEPTILLTPLKKIVCSLFHKWEHLTIDNDKYFCNVFSLLRPKIQNQVVGLLAIKQILNFFPASLFIFLLSFYDLEHL